jgi:outer membrane protein assembly factor BamE
MQSGKHAARPDTAAISDLWLLRKFPMKRVLLLLPFLAACSNTPQITGMLSPYRIDVRQGNFVTQDMVAQLKPGLSREQVRFILGSPLLADMFHADRWDYLYRFQPGHGEVQQRSLAVFFQDNKLTRVAGDVVAEDAAKAEAPRPTTKIIEIPGPAAVGTDSQEKK